MTTKRPALGRGLNALIPKTAPKPTSGVGEPPETTASSSGAKTAPASALTQRLPIEKLEPNPEQPRRHFDEDAIKGLAQSIATVGIIQPIIVHKEDVDRYLILAGERRWRAAQQARVHDVPVVIRELANVDAAEIALLENVQREDLSPFEEAEGYRGLMAQFGYSQTDVAERVGKSRAHVANGAAVVGRCKLEQPRADVAHLPRRVERWCGA